MKADWQFWALWKAGLQHKRRLLSTSILLLKKWNENVNARKGQECYAGKSGCDFFDYCVTPHMILNNDRLEHTLNCLFLPISYLGSGKTEVKYSIPNLLKLWKQKTRDQKPSKKLNCYHHIINSRSAFISSNYHHTTCQTCQNYDRRFVSP